MRWVCPQCGSQVSVALSQCPSCGGLPEGESAARGEAPAPAPVTPPEAKSVERYAPPSPPAEKPSPAVAPPVAGAPTAAQRLLPVPRPVAPAEPEQEGPFWRGVKFGVGFMLVVVMVLLLLALLLPWLREQGWQPWLDSAAP